MNYGSLEAQKLLQSSLGYVNGPLLNIFNNYKYYVNKLDIYTVNFKILVTKNNTRGTPGSYIKYARIYKI